MEGEVGLHGYIVHRSPGRSIRLFGPLAVKPPGEEGEGPALVNVPMVKAREGRAAVRLRKYSRIPWLSSRT